MSYANLNEDVDPDIALIGTFLLEFLFFFKPEWFFAC